MKELVGTPLAVDVLLRLIVEETVRMMSTVLEAAASLDEADKKVDDAANELVIAPAAVDVSNSLVDDTL